MFVKAKTVFRTSDGLATPGCVVEVDEKLGKRLVQSCAAVETTRPATLGAASVPLPRLPGENPSTGVNAPEGPSDGEAEDIDLNTLSYNQLKAMAQEMGIKTGKIKSKAAMIEAICSEEVYADADDVVETGEEPPTFEAQEVVE